LNSNPESNSNFLDPEIPCLSPNYPWYGVQYPLIWILEPKFKLLFGEVQTSDGISKSFEIYLNSFKSSSQNFENCFPVPILLLAQPPCSPSLFSLYFHSMLFRPIHLRGPSTQPAQNSQCLLQPSTRKKTAKLLHLMKPAPLPLWPPAKASSRLCNMELNRLNVLSFSPHSIEDFPSQIR
jgi:hypothetical protein